MTSGFGNCRDNEVVRVSGIRAACIWIQLEAFCRERERELRDVRRVAKVREEEEIKR